DPAYPRSLLSLADPPCVLFAVGKACLLEGEALAIVGSRSATPGGERTAERFAAALSARGHPIVSGMALGIDGAAHHGALEGPGSTLAVLGTGPDRVYPARHRELARRIANDGLLISEFPPGTPPLAGNFPRRNRLIAGLSRGVLVVEAAVESGSLITARLAGEMGREVFAVPGSIHSPQSRGCHRLLREGAKLVETVEDVCSELGWSSASGGASGARAAGAAATGGDAGPAAAAQPADQAVQQPRATHMQEYAGQVKPGAVALPDPEIKKIRHFLQRPIVIFTERIQTAETGRQYPHQVRPTVQVGIIHNQRVIIIDDIGKKRRQIDDKYTAEQGAQPRRMLRGHTDHPFAGRRHAVHQGICRTCSSIFFRAASSTAGTPYKYTCRSTDMPQKPTIPASIVVCSAALKPYFV
ncbi:MAG: DNA-processing protein DprA, partial [Candidatus Omnitrophica bacterium]|nr:DNA-processing protein DprA [Candidatus Omnitrophota bacterium]